MAEYTDSDDFVRDLQDAARHESDGLMNDEDAPQTVALHESRAAMLTLIDRLARRSVPMLGLAAISIAVIAGFYTLALQSLTIPLVSRLTYWLILSLCALFFTAHRLRLFRQGLAYNGRPFSWRAHYTCSLSVLSTALGAGTILLTPIGISSAAVLILSGTALFVGAALGLGHLSHKTAALSASLPCVLLSLCAPLPHLAAMPASMKEGSFALLAGIAAILLILLGWANRRHATIVRNALAAHPRQEMLQVTARQKKISAAYNPFSFRLQQKNPAN